MVQKFNPISSGWDYGVTHGAGVGDRYILMGWKMWGDGGRDWAQHGFLKPQSPLLMKYFLPQYHTHSNKDIPPYPYNLSNSTTSS